MYHLNTAAQWAPCGFPHVPRRKATLLPRRALRRPGLAKAARRPRPSGRLGAGAGFGLTELSLSLGRGGGGAGGSVLQRCAQVGVDLPLLLPQPLLRLR